MKILRLCIGHGASDEFETDSRLSQYVWPLLRSINKNGELGVRTVR